VKNEWKKIKDILEIGIDRFLTKSSIKMKAVRILKEKIQMKNV